MDTQKALAGIRGMRVMQGFAPDLREKLADLFLAVSAPRSVPAGGVFIHEHENVDNKGYILVQGALLVRKEGSPDTICAAPELVGEIKQFNPAGVRTATCAGAVDSIVLRFIWDEFWERANEILSQDEVAKIKDVLATQAWEHFSQ